MNDLNILNELNYKDFNIILKHLKTMGLRYFIKKLNIKISNEMKDAVIRLYLQGTSRNDIAKTCGIGDGTVSNIIDE
jgi:DNA invertase Pin-like site-specific DNA recombinase